MTLVRSFHKAFMVQNSFRAEEKYQKAELTLDIKNEGL